MGRWNKNVLDVTDLYIIYAYIYLSSKDEKQQTYLKTWKNTSAKKQPNKQKQQWNHATLQAIYLSTNAHIIMDLGSCSNVKSEGERDSKPNQMSSPTKVSQSIHKAPANSVHLKSPLSSVYSLSHSHLLVLYSSPSLRQTKQKGTMAKCGMLKPDGMVCIL